MLIPIYQLEELMPVLFEVFEKLLEGNQGCAKQSKTKWNETKKSLLGLKVYITTAQVGFGF